MVTTLLQVDSSLVIRKFWKWINYKRYYDTCIRVSISRIWFMYVRIYIYIYIYMLHHDRSGTAIAVARPTNDFLPWSVNFLFLKRCLLMLIIQILRKRVQFWHHNAWSPYIKSYKKLEIVCANQFPGCLANYFEGRAMHEIS